MEGIQANREDLKEKVLNLEQRPMGPKIGQTN
jgi:hypothetical protein